LHATLKLPIFFLNNLASALLSEVEKIRAGDQPELDIESASTHARDLGYFSGALQDVRRPVTNLKNAIPIGISFPVNVTLWLAQCFSRSAEPVTAVFAPVFLSVIV